MPRIALTKEDKIAKRFEDAWKGVVGPILTTLNGDQGQRRMNNKEYGEFHHKGERFISKWNDNNLRGVAFDDVVKVLVRAGYTPTITIEVDKKR